MHILFVEAETKVVFTPASFSAVEMNPREFIPRACVTGRVWTQSQTSSAGQTTWLWSAWKGWSWAICKWTLEQFIADMKTICANHRKYTTWHCYFQLILINSNNSYIYSSFHTRKAALIKASCLLRCPYLIAERLSPNACTSSNKLFNKNCLTIHLHVLFAKVCWYAPLHEINLKVPHDVQ